MRNGVRCLMILAALLANWPIGAGKGAEMGAAENPPTPGEIPAPDARTQGLGALESGNYFAAAAALREAISRGDVDAMVHLGDMTFAGKGVAQSYEQAVHWYCRAALVGNLDAVDRLETIALGGWSNVRNAQGWEGACEQWLKPKAPLQPAQRQTGVGTPEVRVEIHLEREPDRDVYPPSVLWWSPYAPRHVPWQWQRVNPQNPASKPGRPPPVPSAPPLHGR